MKQESNCRASNDDVAWYVVHTRSLRERMVEDALHRKGFQAYLPATTKVIRHARQSQVVARPLFQRYLFVGLDPVTPQFAEVRKTHGVEWLVTNVLKPVRVPSGAIEQIRQAEADGLFDETRPRAKPIPVKPGDKVTIVEGPFASLAAEILATPSERRIRVVLSLFGRQTKLTTPLPNLKLAS